MTNLTSNRSLALQVAALSVAAIALFVLNNRTASSSSFSALPALGQLLGSSDSSRTLAQACIPSHPLSEDQVYFESCGGLF